MWSAIYIASLGVKARITSEKCVPILLSLRDQAKQTRLVDGLNESTHYVGWVARV